jgi:hypothetical protein
VFALVFVGGNKLEIENKEANIIAPPDSLVKDYQF